MDQNTFVANVRDSGLLTPEQLATALHDLDAKAKPRTLARSLIERGWLTKFQAQMLLGGRTSGFLLGQYRILDQLGRGGMGRVFKAVHEIMNRVVALKIISSSLVKTNKGQQMFKREVLAAARLMHPNIVTAYDANQIGNRHFLIMEFVNGPNLEQLVRRHGPLPPGQACDLILQAANGLQYAHELGMVHRDIKPANLLVQRGARENQCVKILDFGLARLHEPDPTSGPGADTILVRENTVLGTPDFLSPEQARNLHNVDIRSDIYSLGCTFYYVLTGRLPFPGGSNLEKLVRQGTEEPAPIEESRTDVPVEVITIIRRMMAKDPGARFQTPAALAKALEPLCTSANPTWVLPGAAETLAEPLATPANDAVMQSTPSPHKRKRNLEK